MKLIADYKFIILVLLFFFEIISTRMCFGKEQDRAWVGVVLDSVTAEKIENASIYLKEKNKTFRSDSKGVFNLSSKNNNKIIVSMLGYAPKELLLSGNPKDTILIFLTQSPFELQDLTVRKKRYKYSKKNNPAIALLNNVKESFKKSNPFDTAYYSFDRYEKINLGANDVVREDNYESSSKKLGKFRQYVDTAPWTGKTILDLALLEKTSSTLGGRNVSPDKEVITGLRTHGIVEMLPFDNIREMVSDVLREVNIQGNDISLAQNRFVSPLASIGPDFYMYEITDTLIVGGEKCIEVSFAPKTPETFGFNGKLFISDDTPERYIKRVSMRVPKVINLNYINNIFISQNFSKDSFGKIHKTLDDVCMEVQIVKGTPPLFVSRQSRFNNFSYDKKEDLLYYYGLLGNEYILENAEKKREEYWDSLRPIPFSYAERKLSQMTEELRQNKLIYWGEKCLRILFNGYVGTSKKNSKVNIGPVNTFVSYNSLEGLRLKVGGITTSSLFSHLFFRGYGAYGFKDKKWKYEVEGEYSFNEKKLHSREFPMNGIRLSYKYDIDQIGVRYVYSNADNGILSISRKKNDLIAYKREGKAEYNLELDNHLSFNIGYRYLKEYSSKYLKFINGYGDSMRQYKIGGLFATIRWAPAEKFYQTVSNRRPINMDGMILSLTHEYGPKRLFGTDYTINKTEFSFLKRFWFSAFGYTNILLKGGKIWSSVPFPSLLWQNSNLSYTVQQETFALLDPMEFALDQVVSWDIEYFISGALFNRLPLIKKTKLREIISFRGFWGSLSKKNNPYYNKELLQFPDPETTYLMKNKPYMEIGLGVDNIFTFLRVDYIWRLTYRDHSGVDKSGIRVSVHFSF